MSADNRISVDLKTLTVKYYLGENVAEKWKFKTLEEAVIKAQEIDEEYQTEYGISFTGSLKVKKQK